MRLNAPESQPEPDRTEDQLFDDIREFLAEQSGDRLYEELSRSYGMAAGFAERELQGRDEYDRMLRGIERLVVDVLGDQYDASQRKQLAEVLYLYGLAHYSLLQQSTSDEDDEESENHATARPLLVHDIWFPADIAVELTSDGYYLHLSDGRIDVSVYLGSSPNERGALVDLAAHWEYATANTKAVPGGPDLSNSVPFLAIEMDYAGSDLIDASDHVDVLLFDHRGEPIVRIHLRDIDLRAIVDEIQAVESDEDL